MKHGFSVRLVAVIAFALQLLCLSAYAQDGRDDNGRTFDFEISVRNASVSDFADAFTAKTGVLFSYDSAIAGKQMGNVTVKAENASLPSILDDVFGRQTAGFEYRIVNSTVIISHVPVTPVKVTGTIVDTDGQPLIGASVMVKGTGTGTITDLDGKYELEAGADDVLVYSYIGCADQEAKVAGRAKIDIVLAADAEFLEEVVVVGYGKQSEKLLTTSISSVKLDDVDQGNDYNALKMLQGRTPGVNVSTASAVPGSQPNIRVRGIASISGNASPLYVIDGIPSDDMPYLNPNDIERMDVLKDASATAIYGSRANNGVVIITTKSGKNNEKTNINASLRHSFGWIANDIEMANTEEYARVISQAMDNWNNQFASAIAAGTKTEEIFFMPDNAVSTDWMSYLQRKMANTTNANVNLSGGNEKTTFYLSGGLNNQQGILRKTSFTQANFRAKFSHKINNVFKLNVNLSGSYTDQETSEEGDGSLKIIRSAREQQPWASPYREDGTYTKMGPELLRHNPVMVLNEEEITSHRYEGLGSISLDVTPFKGFRWTPSASVYGKFSDGKKTVSEKHDARAFSAGWGAVQQSKNTYYRIVIDNILSYENKWGELTYSIMAGHSYEKYAGETFGALSDNYASAAFPDSRFELVSSGTAIYPSGMGYGAYALESYLGRIALNYGDRYIVNATVRSDGSSRFPKSQRYGTFPSASFAWRISNEPFYPENAYGVSDLKLRLSWGNTGSMAGIGNWSAMSLVNSSTGTAYNGSAGLATGNTADNLTWEKSSQFNVGLDAEFFNGRLRFGSDAYYQKTYGLLYATNLIATSGYTSRTTNKGEIANKGLEFSLSGDIFTGDFKWDMNANISYTHNTLLELDGNIDMEIKAAGYVQGGSSHALIVGKPVGAFYMYKMEGIYQTDEEVPVPLYMKGVRAGDVKYYDLDGNGDITADDRVYVGKATPDFTGGITSNMSWKGFDLSVFCQFAVGGQILAAWRGSGGNEGTESLGYGGGQEFTFMSGGQLVTTKQFFNNSKHVSNNYWNGEGTSNTVPRPVLKTTHTGGYSNFLTSTRYLEDASYFKFKTITLGYNIPSKVLQKARIKGIRVYASLDNFFTFCKYSGYDPEFSYSLSPSSSTYGVDFGEQATLKTFIIGASFNF